MTNEFPITVLLLMVSCSHGKSLRLVRPFSMPGQSCKITEVMESHGKWLWSHGICITVCTNCQPWCKTSNPLCIESPTTADNRQQLSTSSQFSVAWTVADCHRFSADRLWICI